LKKSTDSEGWTEVITPKASLLNIRLGEIWRYRDLLWLFVRRDFISQYKQTVLGPIWHLIQPIFTTIIFLFIFSRVANIPTDGIQPALFYMSGIAIWNYFSSCLVNTSNTFIANAGIFGKVYFPRLIMPMSVIVSNLYRFGIQFGLLTILIVWYYFHGYPIYFSYRWALIPFLVTLMAGLGLGLGIIISSITTKYRDFAILLGFAVQLGMYATPIAYPYSYLKDKGYQEIISLNPLAPVVEAFRYSIFGIGTFSFSGILYSVLFTAISVFGGMILFNRVERSFMDTV
jgi:lipopolysaccharide transport system permease protein